MNKLAAMALAMFLLVGGGTAAFAKPATVSDKGMFEVDGSFGVGSGTGALDSGGGVNFGAGYMLSTIDKNLQARVDLSYYDFSTDFLGYDLSYTRVPFTVSARYYFPINDRLKAFAQAGIETSFDSFESYEGTVNKHTENEVNFGISPGGGIEFHALPNVGIFALGRIHIITDNYFSIQFGAAFHF
jgi:opacity protein-like surface antigen